MKYNEEIWTDLTQEEKKVYHLYEAFQKRTNKMGNFVKWLPAATAKQCYNYDRDGKYPGDKIRDSKNWKYFEEVCKIFESHSDFDEEIFMDSVFIHVYKEKKIYPAQLRTKKIVEFYKEYRMKLKMTDRSSDEKKMMEDLAATYKYIKRKVKKDELDVRDIYTFFNSTEDNNIISDGLKSCILEMISPYFMAISKSFNIAYKRTDKDIQDEIIDLDKLNNLRGLVKMKTRVYSFAKKIFKEEII